MQGTVIEGAAQLDAGQLQFLNGVSDLLQAGRGEVEIARGHLQVFVAEKKLDGAQIRSPTRYAASNARRMS